MPTFFAISGFYVFQADAKTVKRRLLKILWLYLISAAIYHIHDMTVRIFEQGISGLVGYVSDVFLSVGNIAEYLFFNVPFTSVHLWYLLALIYVYLIWLIILKYSLSDKILFVIGTVTLLVNLVIGGLLQVFGLVLNCIYVRNFAFTGLPFFIFGYLIRKYNHLFTKIEVSHLIVAIIIGSCEPIIFRLLIGNCEVYLGSIVCCVSLILLAEKAKSVELPKRSLPVFRSSTDIYVLHILFASFLSSLAGIFPSGAESVIRAIMPCLSFAVCIVFSLLRSTVANRLHTYKRSKI